MAETSYDRLRRLENRLRRKKRINTIPMSRLADRSNPMETYNAIQFKRRYHMTKDTCMYLLNLIGRRLVSPLKRGCQIPPVLQLLSVLRFYCTGSFQLVIADYSTMNQSTVCRLIVRVSIQLAKLRPSVIRFPSHGEFSRIQEEFYSIAGFPGVSGAIDGTLLRIESPGGQDAELFRCRRGYFSLNIQGICDAQLNFINIVAKWYGSCHDSRMFENSSISALMEIGTLPGLLLGVSGYPLKPHLMTPILKPRTPAENRYNYSQIKTRGTIERTFGIWKRRFPCVRHLRTKLKTSLIIIVSTAVLHNITRKRNDLFDEDFLEESDPIHTNEPEMTTVAGKAARLAIITSHFT